MCNYTIYITFKGKIYQTNVIAGKYQSEEEIYNIAKKQVHKQWAS